MSTAPASPFIYLDSNATTRPDPAAIAAMHEAMEVCWFNPSSIHRAGQMARQKVELARKHLAQLIGVKPRFLTFTGSGTESIDLAIRGTLLARKLCGRRATGSGALITSRLEHNCVRELAHALEREEGIRTLWADLDANGVVDAASIERLLNANPDVAIVSIQWANNETGAVQPVDRIGKMCAERGVPFHCDGTQWVGKMPVNLNPPPGVEPSLVCDLLTYSPHKFHGPKGLGVLYAKNGLPVATLIHGEQELGRRGGTENVPSIAGSGAAAAAVMQWMAEPANIRAVAELRDRFETAILAACPEARVNGAGGPRLYNTSSIGFPRLEAEALILLLSERGVCCSAGSACTSGSLEGSPVIRAMGIAPEYAHGTLRFSISRYTTREEIDHAVEIITACVKRLSTSMASVGG